MYRCRMQLYQLGCRNRAFSTVCIVGWLTTQASQKRRSSRRYRGYDVSILRDRTTVDLRRRWLRAMRTGQTATSMVFDATDGGGGGAVRGRRNPRKLEIAVCNS